MLWSFAREATSLVKQFKETCANGGTTNSGVVGSGYLYLDHRIRPASSERRQLSRGHRLRTTRQTGFRKRISAESLLQGERFAHGRLRFRVGRLGAGMVKGAARGGQMDARLQL